MDIYVNDELTHTEEEISILLLLKSMDIDSFKGLAIGLNNQIVPKNQWESKILKDNDKVLMIRASQGG
mgnify:CR=1 FL=1